jgi:hypothetical protein
MHGEITKEDARDNGPITEARDWMRSLVSRIGSENVFIVSKVGARTEQLWAEVLWETGFYRFTGMSRDNVYWVRERTGENGKAPVVQRLRLTHFVDDRCDVLLDIRRHFERQRLSVPELYIVPTVTWDQDSGARPTFKDHSNAKRDAFDYGLKFAAGLHTVPFPPARPPAN